MTRNATVGERLRETREAKQMTQGDVAKLLGLSRAAVTQWETDTTSPSVHKLAEIAKLLETTPQWLAYGVGKEPEVIYKPAAGSVSLKEIVFGEKVDERSEVRDWNIPTDYLKSELRAQDSGSLFIWRVEGSNMEPLYEYGDKVIVDAGAKRPSPSGVFLIWDGVGPSLHNVNVVPISGKPVARVSSTDGKTDQYEVPADKLQVIGRVRGLIKNV